MHRILEATPGPEASLRLRFTDRIGVVDLRPLLAKGGVFQVLQDPAVFGQVVIGDNGRFIEWPSGVDLCADALYQKMGRPDFDPE